MARPQGKILIVSFYWPPVNSPGTQHPTWFFRFLPDFGYETRALVSSSFFAEILTAPRYDAPGVIALPESPLGRKLATRFYQTELWWQQPLRLWEHGFYWGWMAIRAADRLLRKERFTGMISVSPSIASHWTALGIKRRHPYLKWIADFQDPFVGNPFRQTHPYARKWEENLQHDLFKHADYMSGNTNTVKAMWDELYPEFSHKTIVTWGGYDPAEIAQPLPIPARPAPVLSHVGAVYASRVPNDLFDSLFRLLASGRLLPSQLCVEFLGSNDFRQIRNSAQFERLQQSGLVRLRNEYIPRPDAMRVACEADYLLVLDITGFDTKLQVPSKLFDYIRIGRPILLLTPPGSPSQFILERSGQPHVLIPLDASPQHYDASVLKLLTLSTEPRVAAPWFDENFDARQLTGKLAGVFDASTR
jgi:hypothetical protein